MRHLLITLVLLCSLSQAQEKPAKRTCRILFLERPPSAPTELQMFDGNTLQKVELPSMNLSPVYELPTGPLMLTFLSATPPDLKLLPAGAPAIKIPEGMTDFYLLVLSDPTNKIAPVRIEVIDANSEKLSKGQTLWFNFTDVTIGGKLGSQSLLIKPKSNAVMRSPRNDAGSYPVSMAYRKEGENKQFPICSTEWTHDPRSRNLGFIISQKDLLVPRVFMFSDFRRDPDAP